MLETPGIGEMLNHGWLVEDHGNQVEADSGRLDSGAACPGSRRATLRDDLQAVHRALWGPVLDARSRLHLDKDRPAVLLGDDIDFRELWSGPVARQDAETLLLKITMSEVFAPPSQ